MNRFIAQLLSLSLLIVGFSGCLKTEFDGFDTAERIEIPPYNYLSAGIDNFAVYGDSLGFPDYPAFDNHAVAPIFRWASTQYANVAVAVYQDTIIFTPDGNAISNVEDCIWMAFPNDQSGDSEVELEEGYQMVDGSIFRTTGNPDGERLFYLPSEDGNGTPIKYYLMIWAWDDQGMNIKAASKPIPFRT